MSFVLMACSGTPKGNENAGAGGSAGSAMFGNRTGGAGGSSGTGGGASDIAGAAAPDGEGPIGGAQGPVENPASDRDDAGVAIGEQPDQGTRCFDGWVDLERHSAHCGECGNACAPFVLASGLDWPVGIALDATTAFWITGGNDAKVMSAPLAGGEPVTLASAQPFPMDIEVDATHVYWAGQGTIYRVLREGGTPETLVTGTQIAPQAIALDDTYVYWVDHGTGSGNDGALMKVPLAGGEPITVSTAPDTGPIALAIDATHAYWANGQNAGGLVVLKAPLSGGEPVTLATGTSSAYAIAVDATHVYWAGHDTVAAGAFAAIESTVQKVPIDGGEAVVLASGTQIPMGLTIDGASVYWTNASNSQTFSGTPGTDGSVLGVPLASGSTVTLGADQDEPTGIDSNGTTLCWTTTGSGQGAGSVKCLGACSAGSCSAPSVFR